MSAAATRATRRSSTASVFGAAPFGARAGGAFRARVCARRAAGSVVGASAAGGSGGVSAWTTKAPGHASIAPCRAA